MAKTIKKDSNLDFNPVTAAYAMYYRCWSKKYLGGYFSPEGERFQVPSGIQRNGGGWVARRYGKVDGDKIESYSFRDIAYGGAAEALKAAVSKLVEINEIVLEGNRRLYLKERSTKVNKVGERCLFIYPPDDSVPRSSSNRWRIIIKVAETTVDFTLSAESEPGWPEFDRTFDQAMKRAKQMNADFIKKRLFN